MYKGRLAHPVPALHYQPLPDAANTPPRLTGRHFPAGGCPDCKVCSDRAAGKRKQTQWQCKTSSCYVYPCFKCYHTVKHEMDGRMLVSTISWAPPKTIICNQLIAFVHPSSDVLIVFFNYQWLLYCLHPSGVPCISITFTPVPAFASISIQWVLAAVHGTVQLDRWNTPPSLTSCFIFWKLWISRSINGCSLNRLSQPAWRNFRRKKPSWESSLEKCGVENGQLVLQVILQSRQIHYTHCKHEYYQPQQ